MNLYVQMRSRGLLSVPIGADDIISALATSEAAIQSPYGFIPLGRSKLSREFHFRFK